MTNHCYVYYRVDANSVERARRAITRTFLAIEEETGICARLLTKADEPLLWMEVYEPIDDWERFEGLLRGLVESNQLQGYLPAGGARVLERFVGGT